MNYLKKFTSLQNLPPFVYALLLIPNLYVLVISGLIGADRSVLFIDYLFCALILFCKPGRLLFILFCFMFFLITLADIFFTILSVFNFELITLVKNFDNGFNSITIIKNVVFNFLANDIKPEAYYLQILVALLAIFLLLGLFTSRVRGKYFILAFIVTALNLLALYFAGIFSAIIVNTAIYLYYFFKFSAVKLNDNKAVSAYGFISFAAFLIIAFLANDRFLPKYSLIDSYIIPKPQRQADWSLGYSKDVKKTYTEAVSLTKRFENNFSDYDKIFVIVIESLGESINAFDKKILYSSFEDAEFKKHYSAEFLKLPYKGATVDGEFRELCSLYINSELPNKLNLAAYNQCLPNKLRKAGYETIGMHNAGSEIYDRVNWYNYAGFSSTYFSSDIKKKYGLKPTCGTAYKGICEKDVFSKVIPDLIDNDKKQLVYLLTLEAHMPIYKNKIVSSETEKICNETKELKKRKALCRFSQIHSETFSQIKELALKLTDKKVLFLISGDHSPPFYYRPYQKLYDEDKVPGIVIKSR